MSGATLSDALRATATRVPDKEAVITEQRTLSYRELDEGADRVASWVAASGIERGDRVGESSCPTRSRARASLLRRAARGRGVLTRSTRP